MFWSKKTPTRIYLDMAAATPVSTSVKKAMEPFWNGCFANPSAVHAEGVKARQAVECARETIARTLRVRPRDITFTASGTESNNVALFGFVEALRTQGVEYRDIEILVAAGEHPSVAKTVSALKKQGCQVIEIPLQTDGLLDEKALAAALSPKTRLVSIAYANSETGVVQPLNRLSRLVQRYAAETGAQITFHTDASQAPLWLPCALDALGVDLMTLDAGKCYGPKGVGVLVHRPKVSLTATLYGGPQEHNLRPGTENVAGIVGASVAIAEAQAGYETRAAHVTRVRDYFIEELLTLEEVVLNGSSEYRLANNVNVSIPGLDTEFTAIVLDQAGVACSTKSACSGADGGGSTVVRGMTGDEALATSTLRFSLSEDTTTTQIDYVVGVLKTHLEKQKHINI